MNKLYFGNRKLVLYFYFVTVAFYPVKVKLSLCFNWAPSHEAYWGSGGIDSGILDLGTRWR
jgi:hypothetical protein